jgi:hypothetical protein
MARNTWTTSFGTPGRFPRNTQAAKLLNMNRTTLVEKIKKQGIEREHALS